MKNRVAYPIYMIETENGTIAVDIPDFGQFTEGKSVGDAMSMARDVIGMMGITLEDEGREIPEPQTVEYKAEEGYFMAYVDIDFDEYRRMHDTRSIRKNVTIPFYLNEKAERMGLNFSRILQDALIEKIGY